MRLVRYLFIVLLSLAALAQEAPLQPPPPQSENTPVTDHILEPGDKIELHITVLPELEKVYEIRLDGSFHHPLLGEVKAAGRTLSDLHSAIDKRLRRELRNPSFRLGLNDFSKKAMTVSVLGEVQKQGSYEIQAGATVLDAIAQAGGLLKTADPERAGLYRDNKQYEVALQPTLEQPTLAELKNGDILYALPGAPVNVVGAVFSPGVYGMSHRKATPRNAILAAGGAKEEAALGRVRLVRATEPSAILLDLRPDAEVELPEKAEKLQQGDILVIPARQAILVSGAGKPIDLRGGETLIDIVLLSGVDPSKSKLDEIKIIRSKYLQSEDVNQQSRELEEYDVKEFFEEGESEHANVPVHDGDLIIIPQKGKGFNLWNAIGIARSFLFFGI